MYQDVYHHLHIVEPPLGGATPEWLGDCLADARAAFLQRLHMTSSRLRAAGLRMRLAADAMDRPLPPTTAPTPVGIALRLVEVSESLLFTEALYLVADAWQPVWRGHLRLWAERDQRVTALPLVMRQEATGWLDLVRGSLPLTEPVSDDLTTHS